MIACKWRLSSGALCLIHPGFPISVVLATPRLELLGQRVLGLLVDVLDKVVEKALYLGVHLKLVVA